MLPASAASLHATALWTTLPCRLCCAGLVSCTTILRQNVFSGTDARGAKACGLPPVLTGASELRRLALAVGQSSRALTLGKPAGRLVTGCLTSSS